MTNKILKQEINSKMNLKSEISEIKVSMNILDELMQMSGEMTVIRNMINKSVRSIEMQYQDDKDVAMLGELLEEMHKINSDVQNKITDIRGVSVNSLLQSITTSIHGTSRSLNNDIELIIEGDELRFDNSITEGLSKSLIYLIRYSLEHGIENKEMRVKTNKNSKGKICLRFSIVGEVVVAEIEDDGAGINVEEIREKIFEMGLRNEKDIKKMKVEDLHQMIFDSRFSGCGDGIDIVKDFLGPMNGKIHVQSIRGKGTKFRLEIPIPKSVLITDCLFVQTGKHSFGISQDNIIRILDQNKIPKEDIMSLEGTEVLRLNSKILPIFSLSKLLNEIEGDEQESMLIVLHSGKIHFVMRVEKVLDVEDTVIKSLSTNMLKKLQIYRGGTFLADGTIGLIFNIDGIAKKMGFHSPIEMKLEDKTQAVKHDSQEMQNVVVFELSMTGQFCIPEKDILRFENIERDSLSPGAGFQAMPYRGSVLTMVNLAHLLQNKDEGILPEIIGGSIPTIIVKYEKSYIGIIVQRIIDLVSTDSKIIDNAKKQIGIAGCLIINGRAVSLINLSELLVGLKESTEKLCEKHIFVDDDIKKAA